MSSNVILTTGIYDLIKDHILRRKVTLEQEQILTEELRTAEQVLRKDLPADVVSVDRKVKVKEITSNEEIEILLVGPKQAKLKNNKHSVLGDVGLATVGHKVGEIIKWPTNQGVKEYEIVSVEAIS
ncbi:GreA/GreB family elongation factor [Vaginella massiliensis]|uniref:GreA/GreB family elongation factor n=1 Tax=Vaginella massiliensis TaxID=1816680 RepID=UPI000837E7EA|nr:GreA/GreB family elongation factor [Vaginella massiliensis]